MLVMATVSMFIDPKRCMEGKKCDGRKGGKDRKVLDDKEIFLC